MTLIFPKSEEVFVRSNKELEDFINAVVNTIDNHLQYVDDQETKQLWNDLVCNGIVSTRPMTSTVLARILEITEVAKLSNMGQVVEILFKTLPVMSNYWNLTKVNVKSFKVKRLNIGDMKKFWQQLAQSSENPTVQQRQMTLTQDFGIESNSPHPEVIMVENKDIETVLRHSDTPMVEHASSKDGKPSNQLASTPDDDGFQSPKKPVPFVAFGETYQNTFASISASAVGQNSFAAMAQDVATDLVSVTVPTDQLQETDLDLDTKPAAIATGTNVQQTEKDHTESQESGVSFDTSEQSNKKKSPHENQRAIYITTEMYDDMVRIIGQGRHDKLSIELLTKWIEGNIVTYVTNKNFTTQTENMIKQKIHTYVENDFKKMKNALKQCSVEYETKAMISMNRELNQILDKTDMARSSLNLYVDEVKDKLQAELENYKNEYARIQKDFAQQCKDFLQDHVMHRREVFTNQKATFDREFKQMRSDMDMYLDTMTKVKTDMQEEIMKLRPESAQSSYNMGHVHDKENFARDILQLQADMIQLKREVHRSNSQRDRVTSNHETPRINNNFESPRNASIPSPSNDDIHSVHHSSTPPPVQVYIPNTRVRVVSDGITISQATVTKHFYEDDNLWYEIKTSRSVYTFPAEHVQSLPPDEERSTTRNHNRYQPQPSNHIHSGDVSITSTLHDEPPQREREQRQYRTRLMPHQFRLKEDPDHINIQATKMLKDAASWNIEWKDPNMDPKDMYESLKSKIEYYGIYIKSYLDLTKDESICSLKDEDYINLPNAKQEMSKALFAVLESFRTKWFGNNPRVDLRHHYDRDRNGFGYLKKLVQHYHPNLKTTSKMATMDQPQLEDCDTWFSYMKEYRKWVDFEKTSPAKREYTDFEHVSNILKQIDGVEAFTVAKATIDSKMALVEQGVYTFPEDYRLQNIGITIQELLPDDAKTLISTPSQKGATINKIKASGNEYEYRKRADDKKKGGLNVANLTPRQWESVICPACGKAGHHIEITGCDEYAIDENLKRYKKDKKNKLQNERAVKIFEEYQKQRLKTRKSGKAQRNLLRKQLRAAKMELEGNDDKYREVKQYFIKAFKTEYSDFDLVDPRQDHNLEIKEYDILESEPESDSEGIITEEV